MVGATISGTIGNITEKARAESVISRALWGLFLLFVGGLALLLFISSGVALMTAAAMFLGGAGLGFLFGLPRAGRATTAAGEAARRNTNLEEVSDWLTKILVGVGLVEMGNLVEWLGPQLHHLGKGLGGPSAEAEALGLGIIVFNWTTGFLLGFLWTRFSLTRALLAGSAVRRLDELGDDNLALTSVQRYLEAGEAEPQGVKLGVLEKRIKNASDGMRGLIFSMTRDFRSANWMHEDDRNRVARTIPIFRALNKESPGVYHVNYGQLGYALKDQSQPDYEEAERMLGEAIRIRDAAGEKGYRLYEFNRALCRIELHTRAETVERREELESGIVEDLERAAGSARVLDIVRGKEKPERRVTAHARMTVTGWLMSTGRVVAAFA